MAVKPFQQKRIDQQREASNKAAEAQRLAAESLQRKAEDDKEKLNRLDKIVEDSSEKNRNFFAAYLGLLIYVQAIVFSTTDLQLLYSVEGLKMPIIDLTVPLVGFYVVIPFFIIALHFNFLQNLESHHNKLMRWRDAHADGKVPCTSIRPFLFDYAILENEGQMVILVTKANSLLCFNFAPLTLGLLLIRYSDSQDWPVTVWHYLAFVFDVWLVWKLRLALKDNANAQTAKPTVPTVRGFIRDIPRAGLRGGFGLMVLSVTLSTVLMGGTSDDYFVTHVLPSVQQVTQVSSEMNDWITPDSWRDNEFFKNNIQPLRQSIIARLLEWLLPRIAIDPTETVWPPDEKKIQTEAKLAHATDWVEYFEKHGKGFLPTAKSLRFANLPQQNLRKAQLAEAKLQGANLYNTDLHGAYLEVAKLQKAYLLRAELQGADLREAKLQGANLRGTELQRAYLEGTQLQTADLREAKLQDAYFKGAKLQGADMREQKLQGADLSEVELQGADLRKAQLQGAGLRKAKLQGAFFEWTKLQGADLSNANLQGAILLWTNLQGANLSNANLQGAGLVVWLQGADLHKSNLQGTNLLMANLQGAFFGSTNTVGVQDPSKANVFNLDSLADKSNPLFDSEKMKPSFWESLLKEAEHIPDEELRLAYKGRINWAKNISSSDAEKVWIADNSPTLVRETLTGLCHSQEDQPSRLWAAKGFRNNFIKQSDRDKKLKNNPEYQNLLETLDTTLCTHEACKDLRDGIEGLDCKTVTQ